MVLETKCPYESEDSPITQVRTDWIEYMLRDMGVFDEYLDKRVQEAVKRYPIEFLKGLLEIGEPIITMHELECLTHSYWSGFEDGLIAAGVLEKRSDK
jgi:hypothetical protein